MEALPHLIFASAVTFIVCFLLLVNYLSFKYTILIASFKISIPFLYFSRFGNKWTPYDGRKFQTVATTLLEQGHTPWSLVFHWDFLITYVDSTHVIPYWWNVTAQYLFGPYYYSPIFLNVILTVFTGMYCMFILSRSGFQESYYKYYLAFFVLQWDVLVFSSILNIKSIIVTLFITMYLYHFIMMVSSRNSAWSGFHFAMVLLILFIIYWSRFYIVPLLVMSSLAWIAFHSRRKKWVPILALPVVALYPIIERGLKQTQYFEPLTLTEFVFNAAKIVLTPRPWGVNAEFSFLIIPAVFHWLFIFPSIFSSLLLWNKSKYTRLLVIFTVGFVVFYAIFPGLASVRMRYQIVFVITLLQFHMLWETASLIEVKSTILSSSFSDADKAAT